MEPSAPESRGPAGCFIRLFWMLLGNVVLALCATAIWQQPPRSFGAADVLFWLMVVALPAARYVDMHRFGGTTADGRTATMRDWWRYTIGLAIVAAVLWVAVHRAFLA